MKNSTGRAGTGRASRALKEQERGQCGQVRVSKGEKGKRGGCVINHKKGQGEYRL